MPVVLNNPFLGIALTAKQKHAKAVSKKTLYRDKYLTCRARRLKKGKPSYPDLGAKGHCKSQYNKWQKYRGKAGEKAMKLASKLESKGKLDPELEMWLKRDVLESENEGPRVAGSATSSVSSSMTEFEPSTLEDQMIDEGYIEEGPNWLLIGGGLAAAGFVGWMMLRK